MHMHYMLAVILIMIMYSFFLLYKIIKSNKPGGQIINISNIIKDASFVYLKKQFMVIWGFVIFFAILMFFGFSKTCTMGFLAGSLCSTMVCFFNMYVSVNANNRMLQSIIDNGLTGGFRIGILSGLSAGLYLTGLGLLLIVLSTMIICNKRIMLFLLGINVGVSLVCVFARLAGGIFTKGADVGADLVGKVEKSLPEDDIRNPAVIADNVGDNVGDCSGMSADLLESYIITITSTIAIGIYLKMNINIPAIISTIGLVSCTLPIFLMRFKNVWQEMNRYFITSLFTFILSNLGLVYSKIITLHQSLCVMIGAVCVFILLKITEYYTSTAYCPVKSIAKASTSGAGTNIIFGLAISYESTVLPIIFVIGSIFGCYYINGIYGIALGAIGVISLSPAILVMDIFGPVSDNAGGICEMSGLSQNIREITDELDGVGNTTKAITKGFAICSAIFASITMLYTFNIDILQMGYKIALNISDPKIICGLFLGAIIPNLFCGSTLKSVSQAAEVVVQDVRSQLQENPGILLGTHKPDYNRTINFLTQFAIKAMIYPTIIPIIATILSFYGTYLITGSKETGFIVLWAVIVGVTITSVLNGMSMSIAGGAWDNAKKYIESGVHGGKGSDAHKASIIGDTVGDPYKDTVGPALNSICKLINLVAIIIITLQ